MDTTWTTLAILSAIILLIAFFMDLDAIQRRQGGANGLPWLAAHIVVFLGILIATFISIFMEGFIQAIPYLILAVVLLILEGKITMHLLERAINRTRS